MHLVNSVEGWYFVVMGVLVFMLACTLQEQKLRGLCIIVSTISGMLLAIGLAILFFQPIVDEYGFLIR